jgi:hypothetical protein
MQVRIHSYNTYGVNPAQRGKTSLSGKLYCLVLIFLFPSRVFFLLLLLFLHRALFFFFFSRCRTGDVHIRGLLDDPHDTPRI